MINFLKLALVGLISSLFLVGCGSNQPTPEMQGSNLYSQVNFWYEKDKSLATNYQRGSLVPINTEIKVISYSSKLLTFQIIPTGKIIHIVNVPKYTNLETPELFHRYFAKTKVNTSKYSKNTQKAIASGNVVKGMTKKEVLISRGFPPAHVTNIEHDNTWKYWQNRFVTRNVVFDNDKVSSLVGWGAQ